ncbi:Late [Abeliophyllum distichum]|uniref:Late n=1 Tax=Abeliophyllum distichum TaxID=126358 RepID=A0ABD1Q5H9_9LAMI
MVGSAAKPSKNGQIPSLSSGTAANRKHQQSSQKNLSRRVSFNESTLAKSRAEPYGGDLEGQGEKGRCSSRFNMCCACGSLIIGVFLLFILLVGGIYFAFLQSNLPHFQVQRIDVPKLKIKESKTDTFLTSEFNIYLNATNDNGKIELVYSSMHVEVSSEGVDLGKMHVPDFSQKPSTTTELKVHTSVKDMAVEDADAQDLRDKSKVHQLLMDIVLIGHIDFLLHGKKMNGFPVRILCKSIFQSDLDNGHPAACNVKMSPIS